MSNVAKLKKQAAEFEAKKQFDKALAIYIKLLDSFDENASELDVALFNRVGDLLVRQGNVADAVDYYEKAVDLYEQTGFFNNAIALCNKILRTSPGRTSIYYKLGKASAKKGFNTDAKVNFLEYADRMQKAGKVDEAFRALKEFADLSPDQDDIRLMLADQLTKANRKSEAIEQLQKLHERYDAEGLEAEASSIATRIQAIDPTVEPRTSAGDKRKSTSSDLVFLDLGDSASFMPPSSRQPTPARSAAPIRPPTPPRAPTPEAAIPAGPTPAVSAEPTPPQASAAFDATERQETEPPASIEPAVDAAFAAAFEASVASSVESSIEASAESSAAPEPEAVVEPPPAPSPAVRAPIDDIPLLNTDDVIGRVAGTPSSIPLVDASLDRLASDESLGVVKSTPTSSFFAVDALDAQPPETTSAESILDPEPPLARNSPEVQGASAEPMESWFQPTALSSIPTPSIQSAAPVPPPEPIAPTPAKPAAEIAPPPTTVVVPPTPVAPPTPAAAEALDFSEFEIPAREKAGSAEPASIDFDLSSLITPEPSKPAIPPRPIPSLRPLTGLAREPLDDLPLMDFEVLRPPVQREAPPAPAASVTPAASAVPATPLTPATPDLELIVDPALGMLSSVDDDEILADDDSIDLNDESLTIGDEPIPEAPIGRRSTLVAAHSVEVLRASVDLDPEDWSLRRQLAEVMLEAGRRAEGIAELELAMSGAELAGDLDLASSLAEEMARLEPEEVRHHQKRVEYAFRTNDRSRLIEAYVSLADALLKSEQLDKARTVYQRVLDLAPDDLRARSALDTLSAAEEERATPAAPVAAHAPNLRPAEVRRLANDAADSFVNLGDWLRESSGRRDTRMVVAEQEPTGDEEADFADMLRKFKQGVAENVDAEDY